MNILITRILVVIVEPFLPPHACGILSEGNEALPLHFFAGRNTRYLEKGRSDIEVENHLIFYRSRLDQLGITDHHRNANRWFMHQPLVKASKLTEKISMIRRMDDGGIVHDPFVL